MNDPRDPDAEDANARLKEGLKACRTILSDYRARIAERDVVSEQVESDAR